MFYQALAGVREGGTSRREYGRPSARRRTRRRDTGFFWRWFAPLCAVTFVAWSGVLKYATLLGALHPEQPDAMRQRQRLSRAGLCDARLSALLPAPPSPQFNYTTARRRLYQAMEASLASQGLRVGGTQSLSLGDLFRLEGSSILPVLKPLEVPVRAVVIPFADPRVSDWLHEAVMKHLAPILPTPGMWVQNHDLYHSTVFHASTHTTPVLATPGEVAEEAEWIQGVARRSCPLRVVLERVVATPSGTVLACWQLKGGTDPVQLRSALRSALPRAPEKQMVTDEAILHTTLARVISQPVPSGDETEEEGQGEGGEGSAAAAALQRAVEAMTQELCGVEATLDTLWFVEEQDRLALALEGRFSKRPLQLQCEGGEGAPGQQQQGEEEEGAAEGQQEPSLLQGRRVQASPKEQLDRKMKLL